MQLKGVNPVEQHIEKIVLVAVSAIFLIVVATQFLVEPNLVKVGKETPVRPGQAFRVPEAEARRLKGLMERTDIPVPEVPRLDLVDQFKGRMQGPVTPRPTLEVALGNPPAIQNVTLSPDVKPGEHPIHPLNVPAPTAIAVAAFSGTFDPTEPVNTPELQKLLPADQPMDKHAVSVEAHFDGTALAAALKDDGGDKTGLIPPAWYRESMEVLQVVAERQERTGPDAWGDVTVVPPAPGRTGVLEQLKAVHSTADLNDVVAEARGEQEDVLRPAYYHILAGPAWAPPSAINAAFVKGERGDARNPEVAKHVKDFDDASKQVERQKKALEELNLKPVRPTGREGEGGGGGGGGRGGGGLGPSAPQAPGQRAITQAEKDRETKRIENLIKAAEAKQKTAEDALKAVGLDSAGKPLPAVATPPPQQGFDRTAAAKPLLESKDVQVWVHDLTAEPGKVYRYRVKVGVTNPAFARNSALVAEQTDLAKSPVAFSAPSTWSQPVQVLADQYYFITNASEADNMAPARATAEIYRFFYGYYRKAALSVEPGDVVATTIKLPDPSKLPIYDVAQPGQSAPTGQPGPTGSTPNFQPPVKRPPPGKGGQPQSGEGIMEIKNRPNPNQPEKTALPPNAKPYSKAVIQAPGEAMLLDVTKSQGGGESGGPRTEAYLRAEDGVIIVRVPDEEKHNPIYSQVVQSAKEGENQGQPAAPSTDQPGKPKQPIPSKLDPTKPIRPPPPGGGGGGGGGAGGG